MRSHEIEVTFLSAPSRAIPFSPPIQTIEPPQKPARATEPIDQIRRSSPSPESQDELIEIPDTLMSEDAEKKFDHQAFVLSDPSLLIKKAPTVLDTSRSTHMTFQPRKQELPPLPPVNQNADRIDRSERLRSGTASNLSLNDAVRAGAKALSNLTLKNKRDRPIRLDFLPSDAELATLKAIWDRQEVTDQEIYSQLDSSIRISAEGLNRVLTRMTEKGLLKRELISPQNEFDLFGMGRVEMSSQNRRNRQYRYQPLISEEEMITFLNAALYQIENNQRPDFPTRDDPDDLAKRIRKKILHLTGEQN